LPASARPFRLGALAARLARPRAGPGTQADGPELRGVAPLESAGADELAFVRDAGRARGLAASGAGAVILPPDVPPDRPAIVSPTPALDFARAVAWLLPEPEPRPGVHSTAFVDPSARIHASAEIGPGCVVGAGCAIGPGSVLVAHVSVYHDVLVGADCRLHAGVVLREGTRVGDRVILQPGVVLGGDGFGYVHDEEARLHKVPQVGRVVIEDDVEIGAGTTVDRATLSETRIARGAKIDNLVQIAHNCEVGEGSVIAAQSGLGGGTAIGRRAALMARVGAAGHLRVGDGAFVGARAGLHKDVPAGARVFGTPQMEERRWHRVAAAWTRLPDLLRRVRALERKLPDEGGS